MLTKTCLINPLRGIISHYFSLIKLVVAWVVKKKKILFLDRFGYNKIQITTKNQDKTNFTCPSGTFSYRVLPSELYNAPTIFQRVVLGMFFYQVNDCVEISIDDFVPYDDEFDEYLNNLEKVLKCSIQTHLSLSIEKSYMMMNKGIVLGHYLFVESIQVNELNSTFSFEQEFS